MAKIDFFLVVLLIPYNEILCSLPKNDNKLQANSIKNVRLKFNETIPKYYNKTYPIKSNEVRLNKNAKDKTTSNTIDHKIPYSEHEEPRIVPTKPKYTANGQLIHPKKKEEFLDFVPTKLYAQVRGKHTVKRVPKKYAVDEATTDEEKENANRLREVVTNKKTNTVYTEEGYEDSAYDHAGHIRDADFKEEFGRKLRNKYNDKGESNYPTKRKKQNNSHEDTHAESSGKVKVNEDIYPQSVVIKGIRNLENDIAKEIEKTEQNADEYHERISQVRASQESDDDSEEHDNDHEDYYNDDDEDEEGSKNISKNSSLEEGSSKTVEISHEGENLSKNKYFDNLSSKEQDKNIGSSRSVEDGNSRTIEINHGVKDLTFKHLNNSPNKEEKNILTEYKKKTEFIPKTQSQRNSPSNENTKSSSIFNGNIKESYYPNENIKTKEYKTDITPTISRETRLDTSTLPYTFFDHTTKPPEKLSFGDVLWQGFKERQKQRGLNNLNKINNSDKIQDRNPLVSANNDKPYFEKLVSTPVNSETLTTNPVPYNLLENNLLNAYQTHSSFDNIANPLNIGQIETLTLVPPEAKPLISFDPITSAGFYEFKEETTTSAYPTIFFDTTYPSPTTTEKITEYDHNPFLSPFAKQFDRKLKRYHIIPREKLISIDDKLKLPKYNNNNKSANNFESYSRKKNMYTNKKIPYKLNHYIPHTTNYNKKQNFLSSENDLTIMKPPKITKQRILPKAVNYRRPIYDKNGSYDPIFNNYILPRIVTSQFYPSLNLHPPPVGIKNIHSLYNEPISRKATVLSNHIYPSHIVKPNIIRFKRSLNSDKNVVLDQILNKNNMTSFLHINDKMTKNNTLSEYNTHAGLLGRSPQIAQSVVDKEIDIRFPEKNNTSENVNYSDESDNGNVEVEVPELDEFVDDKEAYEKEDYPNSEEETLDKEKYPYYESDLAKQDSTLKYILNPNYVPKKTFGGMEFYDSRILECNDIEPDLNDVAPHGEEPATTRGYNENLPRLRGLGDKLDCFKAKYFDPNPLDNPLFIKKRIDHLEIPKEIDPQKFSSKISEWTVERDEYIHPKLSKTPEKNTTDTSMDVNINNSKKKYRHKYPIPHRYKYPRKNRPLRKTKKRRPVNQNLIPLRLYGHQVYDDVMGTIKKSKMSEKRKRFYRNPIPDSSTRKKHFFKPLEDSSKEFSAVKLRFIPINSKTNTPSLSQIDLNDKFIPVIDMPLAQLPNKVRILKGGPYEAINIRKPNGLNLKINYRVLPDAQNYHKRKIYKRSVENQSEQDTIEENPIITNSHQLNLNSAIVQEPPSIKNNTFKIIYTVPARIKNSRPENEANRHGEFNTESSSSKIIDRRRHEPRYNPIPDKYVESSVTSKSPLRIIVKDPAERKLYSPIISMPAETVIRVNHDVQSNQSSKPKVYQELARNDKNVSKLVEDDNKLKKIDKRYEVHETPNEEEPKLRPNLKSESTSKPITKDYSTENEDETSDYNEDKEESLDNDENSSKNKKSSNYNSSEERSSNNKPDHSKEDDDYSAERDEDKNNFSRFNTRPYSPPEYFEDPKYADLGPRINKPAFYHPTFKPPKYETYKFGKHIGDVSDESYESEESDEKSKYVYPWDKHESEESKHFVHSIKRYEYPWERRDRLKNEKKKKKSYYGSIEEDDDEEDDGEDTASSEDYVTYYKPWNVKIYKAPKRKNKTKNDFAYDNEEGTSNIKPTVAQMKLRPNVTVSKVNRTIIQIIKNPILPINKADVSTKQPIKVTTPPSLSITLSSTNLTVSPLAANMSTNSNIEILKTRPRGRAILPNYSTSSSTTTSLPNVRRRPRYRFNLIPTTEVSSTTNTYLRNRRRPIKSSTE